MKTNYKEDCYYCNTSIPDQPDPGLKYFRYHLGGHEDEVGDPTIKFHTDKVTRLEVIDEEGRLIVLYNVTVQLSLQDDDRTLKVFCYGNQRHLKPFAPPTRSS